MDSTGADRSELPTRLPSCVLRRESDECVTTRGLRIKFYKASSAGARHSWNIKRSATELHTALCGDSTIPSHTRPTSGASCSCSSAFASRHKRQCSAQTSAPHCTS